MDTCFCGSRDLHLPVEAGSLGRDPDKISLCVEKPESENAEANHMGAGTRESTGRRLFNCIRVKS